MLELVDVIKTNLEATLPRNVSGDTIIGNDGSRVGTISYRKFPSIVVTNDILGIGESGIYRIFRTLSAFDPMCFDQLVTAIMEVVKINRVKHVKRKSLYESTARARKRAKRVRR